MESPKSCEEKQGKKISIELKATELADKFNKDLEDEEKEGKKREMEKELMEQLRGIRKDIKEGRKETALEMKRLSDRLEAVEKRWQEREARMTERLVNVEERLKEVEEKTSKNEKELKEKREMGETDKGGNEMGKQQGRAICETSKNCRRSLENSNGLF